MKKRIKLLFTTIITTLFLCSCSSDEQVELDAWKEKLRDTTKTHSVDNPLPEIKDGISNAADTVGDKVSSGKDKVVSFGDSVVNKVKDWADTPSDLPLVENQDGETTSPSASEDINEIIETASGTGTRIHVNFKRVVDGDTIVVTKNGTELPRIRLIGINTPESVHPDESKNVAEGKYASDYLKEYMTGIDDLWLEIDIETHDDYGRVLAYVWLSETSSASDKMLNVHMVSSGWAEPMTIEPNSKYKNLFAEAAK